MLMEHDQVGALLKEIRELTENYEVPNDLCQSFHIFYKKLKFLKTDKHLHIHKKNNVLFLKLNSAN